MKIININNMPCTEICVNQEWHYVPDYIFSNTPEDYKNPIKTLSWRDKDGTNMYREEQKCIMRGSNAGLMEIASKKESGKYVYHYYLATKLGARMAKQFKTTGKRFFHAVSSDTAYHYMQWNVQDKFLNGLKLGFNRELTEEWCTILSDYETDIVRINNKTLIVFAYPNPKEPLNYEAYRSLVHDYTNLLELGGV
jgi:hypothetical protein